MRVFFRPAINNIWLQRRVPIITSTIGGGVRKQQHIAAGTFSMGVLLFVIVIVIVATTTEKTKENRRSKNSNMVQQ